MREHDETDAQSIADLALSWARKARKLGLDSLADSVIEGARAELGSYPLTDAEADAMLYEGAA